MAGALGLQQQQSPKNNQAKPAQVAPPVGYQPPQNPKLNYHYQQQQ
jgi:hypothetical protein